MQWIPGSLVLYLKQPSRLFFDARHCQEGEKTGVFDELFSPRGK
jgi:hypothetical protein